MKAIRRLVALVFVVWMMWAPVVGAKVMVLDSTGAIDTKSSFSVFGTSGVSVTADQMAGPVFALAKRTMITEVGAFLNNCVSIVEGVPQCPSAAPFLAFVYRLGSVPGVDEPEAGFVLSHDHAPLLVSYEFAESRVVLDPGIYVLLFAAQGSDEGFLLSAASDQEYVAETALIEVFDGSVATIFPQQVAVRILGHPIGRGHR